MQRRCFLAWFGTPSKSKTASARLSAARSPLVYRFHALHTAPIIRMASETSAVAAPALVPKIAPSMLSSDFANLAAEAQKVLEWGGDYLHMDVMDGHFVPNLTLGAPIVKALRKHTEAFLDCHLMVSEPEKWVQDFADAGASSFTFHIEATDDASGLIDRIHAAGMRAAIAVKPKTSLDAVLPLAEKLDMVLIMTVEPGFGGQKFMADMMPKVQQLRARFPALDIQVDGGLSPSNIDIAAEAGANVIVAGTSVFKAEDPAAAIAALRAGVARALEAAST